MNILIIDRPQSWHVRELQQAAGTQTTIDTVSYEELQVQFDDSGPGCIPRSAFSTAKHPLSNYDCVLTRAMPASTLEQVVFRMDWLDQVARQYGTLVINPARTVEASVDKYLSLEKMRSAGIPVPGCHVSQTTQQALAFFRSAGGDSVVKPIFGSRGKNIVRVRGEEQAKSVFNSLAAEGRVIYQQRYVEHGDQDFRLLVIGDHVFGLRRQRPGHWITNASCGAEGYRHQPSTAERKLAIAAARSVDAVIAGVDLVYDREQEEQPCVVEINACPSWRATQAVADENISRQLLSEIERRVEHAGHPSTCHRTNR